MDKYFCILQSGMSGIARVLSLTTEERSAEREEGAGQRKLVVAPPGRQDGKICPAERDLRRGKTPGRTGEKKSRFVSALAVSRPNSDEK